MSERLRPIGPLIPMTDMHGQTFAVYTAELVEILRQNSFTVFGMPMDTILELKTQLDMRALEPTKSAVRDMVKPIVPDGN